MATWSAAIVAASREKPELAAALALVAADEEGKISPRRLGKWLAASENKIAGGYKLQRNEVDKQRIRWLLSQAET